MLVYTKFFSLKKGLTIVRDTFDTSWVPLLSLPLSLASLVIVEMVVWYSHRHVVEQLGLGTHLRLESRCVVVVRACSCCCDVAALCWRWCEVWWSWAFVDIILYM